MPVTSFAGRAHTVSLWNATLDLTVKVQGSGPPLLYLHPAGGLIWDSVLDALSEQYTVYAPEHPGTSADHTAIHRVETWTELMLMYEQLLRELKLDRPVLMGQSYGGMMAADLAAMFPERVGKLILLDPIGLWRDDAPIPLMRLVAAMPPQVPPLLFHDPNCEGARSLFTPSPDPEVNVKGGAAFVWALGCTGKFFWPIADHGLSRRLHRIAAPTLIVWGRQDTLVPVAYADDFHQGIAASTLTLIDQCGHIPQLEQPGETLARIRGFLTS